VPVAGSEPPLGGDGFVLEAEHKRPGSGGAVHKRAVLCLVERGGKIRSFKLGSPSRQEIAAAIKANVDPAATLHKDGSQVCKFADVAAHESVDHLKKYVRQG
jgi:hypothetical protein